MSHVYGFSPVWVRRWTKGKSTSPSWYSKDCVPLTLALLLNLRSQVRQYHPSFLFSKLSDSLVPPTSLDDISWHWLLSRMICSFDSVWRYTTPWLDSSSVMLLGNSITSPSSNSFTTELFAILERNIPPYKHMYSIIINDSLGYSLLSMGYTVLSERSFTAEQAWAQSTSEDLGWFLMCCCYVLIQKAPINITLVAHITRKPFVTIVFFYSVNYVTK